ncbi:MAG: permease prefix domain 1-containing protein, partial [Bifidobacteriaceae bacterium]|nr:permease prefix domain 1-containing protein [Bifidobacteriaceae bacterium]
MNTREQIKEIFADYPSSEELNNFMEELESNVNAHVAQLRRKGISEAEAIKIALDELGDVAALADELNLKNKQEMFSYRYMKTRNFLTPGRTALYVGGSLILVLALKVPMVLALVGWRSDWLTVGLLAVGGLSLLGIVYLGLTQETGARYGMPTKRALGYVGAIALVLPVLAEGLIVAAVFLLRGSSISEWFAELGRNSSAQTAVVISIISGVIGIAWSVWLMVTEKDHKKLWVKQMNDRYAKQWTENYLS